MSEPDGPRPAATVDAILCHFASLMRHVAGWHAPDFLGLDVTMSQAKCLYVATVRPGIGMSAMADQLGVGLSSISGLVDRLVEHGYLERREDPDDRRQQQLWLTPAGSTAVEHIRELNGELLRSLLDGLSSRELEALRIGIAALDRESQTIDPPDPAAGTPSHERTSA
jgi:DNA-binding MarR family transcriptional regulator